MNLNEKEFDHMLVKPSQTSARISVPARADLVQAGRPDVPYGRQLCRYRKEMILKVGKDCVPSKFQLEEVSCQYEQTEKTASEDGCLYHVSWG
jgi:hypothetical protein